MIYKDFHIIPAWNYIQILDSGNLAYLYVLDNYFELPEIKEDLEPYYQQITGQYMEYRYGKNIFKKYKRITDLTIRFNQSNLLAYFITSLDDKDFIERLANWGYQVDLNNFEQSLERIKHNILNLQNAIEIENFEIEREKSKGDKDIWLSIRAMKKICGEFDLKQISLKEFAAIEKLYEKEIQNKTYGKKQPAT